MCLLEGSINWLINRKYKNLLKERKAREKTSWRWTEKEKGFFSKKRIEKERVFFFFWSELNEARGFCLVKQIETDMAFA